VLALGGLAADDAGPGDVVPDGGGVVELGPDVDEDEVAGADGREEVAGGLVVGVGGVGAGGAVGAVVGEEAFAAMPSRRKSTMANSSMARRAAAGAVADVLPAGGEDWVDLLLGGEVGGDLGFGEDGFEDG
jgi:hypothetical protein